MMIVSVPSKHVFNEFYLRQDEILPSTTLTAQNPLKIFPDLSDNLSW